MREIVYPSEEVQTAVESGFFAGAGYYRPDFGPQQLIAQIAGRLFAFTPDETRFTVTEITVPGDPNDPSVLQVWMFQAEKWMIVADGTAKNLIFYDGVSSRRSYGPSVLLGTATAFAPAAPPAIGETVQLTLSSPYTGPFNVPVLFNGAYYLVVEGGGTTPTYSVRLTNAHATVGASIPSGSTIEVRPDLVGYNSAVGNVQNGIVPGQLSVDLNFTAPHSLVVGDSVVMTRDFGGAPPPLSETWTVITTPSPTSARFATPPKPFPYATLLGTIPIQLISKTTTSPTITVGKTTSPFTNPAVAATVDIVIDTLYSGPAGQVVWIGTDQYTIEAIGGGTSSTTLFVQNLTDTSNAAYVNSTDLMSVAELPPGRMGAYGIGHVALSLLDGTSFIYGDTVGGPSGTPIYNFRDAVLKTNENTFLTGGGSFRIPNTGDLITSVRFAAVLDAAYGQGPLQIGTPSAIFTCAVPTDRQLWVALENPILTETLIGSGPLAQNSTIPVNSDTFFRHINGEGSMIFGRRDFVTWGNTPISAEVTRAMARDNQTLLNYGSAVTFDNRFLGTSNPQVSGKGVSHSGFVDLNFDPVSSLRGKAPSIWESLWTGINTLQVVSGIFGSSERCFAFTFNGALHKIELYEITKELLPGVSGETYDNAQTPITWEFETAALFNKDVKPRETMVSLRDGEFGVSNVIGDVRFAVYYRPDQHSCWIPWHSFAICGGTTQPQNFPRLGLGEPTASNCIASLKTPARDAYTFQVKFVIQGTCTFNYARFMAVTMPTPKFQNPICKDNTPICVPETCTNVADGSTDELFYSLQNSVFTNQSPIVFIPQCPDGFTCPPGSLPLTINYPAGHFTLPNPVFSGGFGPTPAFSSFLSLKGCSSQIFSWVPATATQAELETAANLVIQEVAAQQAICDTLAILTNPT